MKPSSLSFSMIHRESCAKSPCVLLFLTANFAKSSLAFDRELRESSFSLCLKQHNSLLLAACRKTGVSCQIIMAKLHTIFEPEKKTQCRFAIFLAYLTDGLWYMVVQSRAWSCPTLAAGAWRRRVMPRPYRDCCEHEGCLSRIWGFFACGCGIICNFADCL